MSGGLQLSLIDSDSRRRAGISHALIGGGAHVEPFEGVAEIVARWPRTGMILAHDDGDTLTPLIDHMIRSGAWLPLVAFAETPAIKHVVQAMQDGVLDYIVWPFAEGELGATLAIAEERGRTITNAKLRETMARSRIAALSDREREVLSGVASGLSNDAIGRQLGISSRTVEIHRAKMLVKLGAKHSSEAIRIAIEAALFD
jgi:two-component system response regulator FixJ